VGRNLAQALSQRSDLALTRFDSCDDPALLSGLVGAADFIFHLAGVNRPLEESEFARVNAGLTRRVISYLVQQGRRTPFLLSSSTQAASDTPYGLSKRAAEEAVFAYGRVTGAPVYVYRLPNLFGKWCRPDYNSAVATFCHNVANALPIQVNDPSRNMELVYIDDVVRDFLAALDGGAGNPGFCQVHPVHSRSLGEITRLIRSFRATRDDFRVPDLCDPLTDRLYSTYLSYLPEDAFSYPLRMNRDERGSFSEFLKTPDRGQVSVNVTAPGVTKGNHWHASKNEKFLVVSGEGVIRFRRVDSLEVLEYPVSGARLEAVDIPTGYTHSISNTGSGDLVTVIWCNELYDPEKPDTFFEPVLR